MSTPKLTYTFVCPVCEKRHRSDEPGEPCCTGPSETRDEHPLQVMRLLNVARTDVHPQFAEQRAARALIMPGDVETVQREALILRV